MITVSKRKIGTYLLIDALSELRNITDKMSFFEKKYRRSFKEFEKKIMTARKEKFEEWDDYMEWKAFTKCSEELSNKIESLKRGRFKIT